MSKWLAIVILLLITEIHAFGPISLGGGTGSLTWVLTENSTIIIQIEANCKCWVGIGLHIQGSADHGMEKGDFLIAQFGSDGKISVEDWMSDPSASSGQGAPKMDIDMGGKNNIMWVTGSQTDTKTSFTFERALDTNDTCCDHPIQPGSTNVVWAHGVPTNANGTLIHYHAANRGEIVLDFWTGESALGGSPLKYLHGALMTIAFGLCLGFGIFVARFLKGFSWWFPLHILVQVSGLALAAAGFVIALVMVEHHFRTVHSWFGLSTLCLAFLAGMLGSASHITFNPNRSSTPIWPDIIHWWVGRATVVLAYVTILLGLSLLQAPTALLVIFAGVPALWLCSILFVEIHHKIYSHSEGTEEEKATLLKNTKLAL